MRRLKMPVELMWIGKFSDGLDAQRFLDRVGPSACVTPCLAGASIDNEVTGGEMKEDLLVELNRGKNFVCREGRWWRRIICKQSQQSSIMRPRVCHHLQRTPY